MVRYGVVGDVHNHPERLIFALNRLRDEYGVDVLVGNGDLCEAQGDPTDCYNNGAITWTSFLQTGLESYLIPGNHDNYFSFAQLNDRFALNHPNRSKVKAFTHDFHKIRKGNHNIIFIPGSDFFVPNGFVIGEEHESGKYIRQDDQLKPFQDGDLEWITGQTGQMPEIIHYTNLNEFKYMIGDSELNIVFCHIPRRFEFGGNSVDSGHFIDVYRVNTNGNPDLLDTGQEDHVLSKVGFHLFDENTMRRFGFTGTLVMPHGVGNFSNRNVFEFAKAHSDGIVDVAVEKKGGNGNVKLGNLFDELGINIAVNGHFHKFIAHNSDGNSVFPNTPVDDLYVNHGSFDNGDAIILDVNEDGKVSYERPKIF
jgi:UDP-2,3-diacylglucosamine pyrophosphatase LpxH